MVLTGTLRKWNPRPACGTAFTSVRISMSVSTSQESRVVGRHDSAAGAPEQLREMTQPREMTHPRTKVVLQSRQFSASSSTDCSAY